MTPKATFTWGFDFRLQWRKMSLAASNQSSGPLGCSMPRHCGRKEVINSPPRLGPTRLGGKSRFTDRWRESVDSHGGPPKKAIWGFFRLIPYLIGMGSVLVLRPVARVAEGFRASWELAHVRLLSCVRSQVGLQVLQTTVRLPAALELKERRRLVRLCALRRLYKHRLGGSHNRRVDTSNHLEPSDKAVV